MITFLAYVDRNATLRTKVFKTNGKELFEEVLFELRNGDEEEDWDQFEVGEHTVQELISHYSDVTSSDIEMEQVEV